MKILAIDTSQRAASIAAAQGDTPLGEWTFDSSNQKPAGEALFPLLAKVCAELGWKTTDIERWAVGAGPGSFTGIRVALAAVQGIVMATGAEARAVTSFAALRGARDLGPVVVVLPGLPGEFFVQVDQDAAVALDAAQLAELHAAHPEHTFLGEGVSSLGLTIPGPPHDRVHASSIAQVARTAPPGPLVPLYVGVARITQPRPR